jgi:release factor glutamine methyltransferase
VTVAEILSTLPAKKRADAIWLLSTIIKKNRAELLLGSREQLPVAARKKWVKFWRERQQGKPLQFITGSAPFWGRDLLVREGVLIPRPETEILVELTLALFPPTAQAWVLDIGTGSGAIAVTLKLERPHWRVAASDISARALKIAKKNAQSFGAEIEFQHADLFAPKLQKIGWNVVVANLPYLDLKKDKVAGDVKVWEPKLALEPEKRQAVKGVLERAAWCAERVLLACAKSRPNYTALELSPRIALYLERRWRRDPAVERIWRAPDLAGRKRFLLIAWRAHG